MLQGLHSAKPTPAAMEVDSSLSWDEFQALYLPHCVSEFCTLQGWNCSVMLTSEQAQMLEAFQQEVFQTVNRALRNLRALVETCLQFRCHDLNSFKIRHYSNVAVPAWDTCHSTVQAQFLLPQGFSCTI